MKVLVAQSCLTLQRPHGLWPARLLSPWDSWGFPGGSDGEESARNAGNLSLIPGLGGSPGERHATHSTILAWKIPWAEESGRLQSMGSQRVGRD